jgi:hypothetical protein
MIAIGSLGLPCLAAWLMVLPCVFFEIPFGLLLVWPWPFGIVSGAMMDEDGEG